MISLKWWANFKMNRKKKEGKKNLFRWGLLCAPIFWSSFEEISSSPNSVSTSKTVCFFDTCNKFFCKYLLSETIETDRINEETFAKFLSLCWLCLEGETCSDCSVCRQCCQETNVFLFEQLTKIYRKRCLIFRSASFQHNEDCLTSLCDTGHCFSCQVGEKKNIQKCSFHMKHWFTRRFYCVFWSTKHPMNVQL